MSRRRKRREGVEPRERRSFTISGFERATWKDRQYWVATVVENGERFELHNRYGSWMRDHEDGTMSEVRLDVAMALVKKRKKMERRETREEVAT